MGSNPIPSASGCAGVRVSHPGASSDLGEQKSVPRDVQGRSGSCNSHGSLSTLLSGARYGSPSNEGRNRCRRHPGASELSTRRRASSSVVVRARLRTGRPEPYFDKTRGVWVAPWRKADGRVGKPTGKTKAAAIASRDRHIEKCGDRGGHDAGRPERRLPRWSEFVDWWLENVIRHRVPAIERSQTYTKQMRTVVRVRSGDVAVGQSSEPEQVAGLPVGRCRSGHGQSCEQSAEPRSAQVLREAENLGIVEEQRSGEGEAAPGAQGAFGSRSRLMQIR